MGFYYLIGASSIFRTFEPGNLSHNIREETIRFFFASGILFLAGHALQHMINDVYHQAVVRSAMVPIIFWNFF